MENEAVDAFLKDLNEGENPFEVKPEEIFPIEKKEPEEKPEEDKPLPFHKDPKIQRFIDKAVASAVEKIKPADSAKQFTEETKGDYGDVVNAFTAIIGNDTPEKVSALGALKKALEGADERAATKASSRLIELQKKAQDDAEEETQRAVNELNKGLEEVEETFKVDFTSNKTELAEFKNYIRKIAPKDEDGEIKAFPDLVATYEAFTAQKKPTNSRAKELASRGMSRSSDASAAPVATPKDWNSIDKLFAKLKR